MEAVLKFLASRGPLLGLVVQMQDYLLKGWVPEAQPLENDCY